MPRVHRGKVQLRLSRNVVLRPSSGQSQPGTLHSCNLARTICWQATLEEVLKELREPSSRVCFRMVLCCCRVEVWDPESEPDGSLKTLLPRFIEANLVASLSQKITRFIQACRRGGAEAIAYSCVLGRVPAFSRK